MSFIEGNEIENLKHSCQNNNNNKFDYRKNYIYVLEAKMGTANSPFYG